MTSREVLMQPVTVQMLRDLDACEEGLDNLLAHVGTDAEAVTLLDVLRACEGKPARASDPTWFLAIAIPGADRERRLYACWCASRGALSDADRTLVRAARLYSLGRLDADGLYAARATARDAACPAACAAARAAACDAAWAAARPAAWDAAHPAAWAAACDAAWAAQNNYLRSCCLGERDMVEDAEKDLEVLR